MARISIPQPPHHGGKAHSLIQEGIHVAYIWVFSDRGLGTIETQYANARQIMKRLGVSRATAYRIIKRQHKRYWLCDMRPTERERCYSVLPVEVLQRINVLPVGNPNFTNGIYQQGIARRLRRKRP
ncbi:MAG: hypothetical protein IJD99_00470 [Clostridia bacterium]|nr:hypothetical protein [Clostridia bacterium]